MKGTSLALLGVGSLALLAWLTLALGVWPVAAPPPAQRADLRPELARRQVEKPATAMKPVDAPPAPGTLEADVLCEQPRAGGASLLAPGADGRPRLLVPCGDGADLWALGNDQPDPLLHVEVATAGLELGPALGTDVDGDGQWDLLFTLVATEPDQAYRQGLYWVRGRVAGGFETPVHLLQVAVDALLDAQAQGLWVAVHEAPPEARPLLWHLSRGPSPTREGQWELPGVAVGLRLDAADPERGLWGLGGGTLWRKDFGAGELETLLDVPGARGLSELGGQLWVRSAEGLRALEAEGPEGAWALGDARSPGDAEATVVAGDGTRLATAGGALWHWRGSQPAQAVEGVGGARVEDLFAQGGTVWAWLSGLSGAQASGLLELPTVEALSKPNALRVRPGPAHRAWPRVHVP